jgi:hypothetical protein
MTIRIPQLNQRAPIVGLAFFYATLFSGGTWAQPSVTSATTTTPATPPASISTKSTANVLQFDSVFDRYQSFKNEKVGSWRDANDTVNRVGGWREYLKQSQQPDPPETTTPKQSPTPATTTNTPASPEPTSPPVKPNPHAGHGVKP